MPGQKFYSDDDGRMKQRNVNFIPDFSFFFSRSPNLRNQKKECTNGEKKVERKTIKINVKIVRISLPSDEQQQTTRTRIRRIPPSNISRRLFVCVVDDGDLLRCSAAKYWEAE